MCHSASMSSYIVQKWRPFWHGHVSLLHVAVLFCIVFDLSFTNALCVTMRRHRLNMLSSSQRVKNMMGNTQTYVQYFVDQDKLWVTLTAVLHKILSLSIICMVCDMLWVDTRLFYPYPPGFVRLPHCQPTQVLESALYETLCHVLMSYGDYICSACIETLTKNRFAAVCNAWYRSAGMVAVRFFYGSVIAEWLGRWVQQWAEEDVFDILEAWAAKLGCDSWSSSLIAGIYPAASARKYVLLSPQYKIIHMMIRYMLPAWEYSVSQINYAKHQ